MVAPPEKLSPYFADYPLHLFQVLGNDGRDFKNEDLRVVFRNADALRSKRGTDEEFDAELVKYIAAFVNSERLLRLADKKGRVSMCTALEEMIKDGELRGELRGKAESVLELLRELGTVSDELRNKIMAEKNMEVLNAWLKKAARAESVKQFQSEIG